MNPEAIADLLLEADEDVDPKSFAMQYTPARQAVKAALEKQGLKVNDKWDERAFVAGIGANVGWECHGADWFFLVIDMPRRIDIRQVLRDGGIPAINVSSMHMGLTHDRRYTIWRVNLRPFSPSQLVKPGEDPND